MEHAIGSGAVGTEARTRSPEAIFLALLLAAFLGLVALTPGWMLGHAPAGADREGIPAVPAAQVQPAGEPTAPGFVAVEVVTH
jgi:hypothetical protein